MIKSPGDLSLVSKKKTKYKMTAHKFLVKNI